MACPKATPLALRGLHAHAPQPPGSCGLLWVMFSRVNVIWYTPEVSYPHDMFMSVPGFTAPRIRIPPVGNLPRLPCEPVPVGYPPVSYRYKYGGGCLPRVVSLARLASRIKSSLAVLRVKKPARITPPLRGPRFWSSSSQ